MSSTWPWVAMRHLWCQAIFLLAINEWSSVYTAFSMWERVLRGVHQGSVLGPTLFNVFINGLAYTIKQCRIINYADDTNIHRYSRNVRDVKDNLNNDFKNATTCRVYSNGLKPNLEKYQAMVLFAEQRIGLFKSGNIDINLNHTKWLWGCSRQPAKIWRSCFEYLSQSKCSKKRP